MDSALMGMAEVQCGISRPDVCYPAGGIGERNRLKENNFYR